jgi:hypothetical protein
MIFEGAASSPGKKVKQQLPVQKVGRRNKLVMNQTFGNQEIHINFVNRQTDNLIEVVFSGVGKLIVMNDCCLRGYFL